MTKASNVVITRPNVIQARPGFHKDTTVWADGVTDYVPVEIISYRDGNYFFIGRNSSGAFGLFASSSKGQMTGNATPPEYDVANTSHVESRGNVYLTTTDGVRKIVDAPGPGDVGTSKNFEDAGLPPTPSGTAVAGTTGVSDWLPDNASGAYQWCVRREDQNDLVVRSAPSPWLKYTNKTGADGRVKLTIQLPPGILVDDVIEIYRSRIAQPVGVNPTTPTADLYLVNETRVSSSMLSDPYALYSGVFYEDNVNNELAGRALYTSSNQGGALAANYPPPRCLQLAAWKNCTWFADTVSKHYVNLLLSSTAFMGPSAADIHEGTTPRLTYMECATAGTATAGDNYFLISGAGISSGMTDVEIAQVVVGMGVSDPLNHIPVGTHITAVEEVSTTYKFSLSQNISGAGALTINARFHDIVKITSSSHTQYEFWANNVESTPAGDEYRRNFICTNNEGETARSLARAISTAMEIPGTFPVQIQQFYNARSFEDPYNSDLYGTVFVERTEYGTTGFTVTSTKPTTVDSRYPSTTLSSVRDTHKNRVYFSKVDQPEHVPVSNWLSIGESNHRILAITPLEEQLVCWTERGVYSITGYGPSNWRVDMVDPNLRLVSPEAHCSLGGSAYGWTNIGIVRVNGGSTRSVSGGVVQDQIEQLTRSFSYGSTGNKGIFMAGHLSRGLLAVGVPAGAGAVKSDHLLILCLSTGAWTRWALEARDLSYSVNDEAFTASLSDTFEIRHEAKTGEAVTHDGSHTITALSAVDGTIYLPVGSDWVPEVDDTVLVVDLSTGSVFGEVATVDSGLESGITTDDTSISVFTEDGTPITVPAGYGFTMSPPYTGSTPSLMIGYESIVCEMEWNVHTLGDPGVATKWREMQIQLFDTSAADVGPPTMKIGASNERSTTPSTTSVSMPTEAVESRPFRVQFSRDVHRSSHLRPYIKVSEAGWAWKLAGFGVLASKGGRASR